MLVAALILFAIAALLYVAKWIYDTTGHLKSDWPRVHQLWVVSFATSLIGGMVCLVIVS